MRVLAVDDEELQLRRLLKLTKEVSPNAEVFDFQKPGEALAFFGETPCDVALIDIQMGGMNGVVLAKSLKDIKPDVNIIFCTGYSEYSMQAMKLRASGYLLKPVDAESLKEELLALRHPVKVPSSKRIFIRTFGNFEVFCDGQPVDFTRSKSKEILAFLVDKQGTGATSAEIAAAIFGDESYDISKKKQFSVFTSELRKTLKAIKAEDILIRTRLGMMIDKSKVDCDYYRLLDGDAAEINSYTGKYMEAYSWAEFTGAYIERAFKG